MKKFEAQNLIFETKQTFDENNLPPYLTHKTQKWFYDDYVAKLEVGQYVDTDFQRITRIE